MVANNGEVVHVVGKQTAGQGEVDGDLQVVQATVGVDALDRVDEIVGHEGAAHGGGDRSPNHEGLREGMQQGQGAKTWKRNLSGHALVDTQKVFGLK